MRAPSGCAKQTAQLIIANHKTEETVINRSESRLIALEQRNQAARSKQKANLPAPGTQAAPAQNELPARKAG
jgi:hypothetical protein